MGKKIGFAALGILGSAVALELLLRAFYRDPAPQPLFAVDPSPAVTSAPWFSGWQAEHDGLRRRFQAYELFGLHPFQGEHITILSSGFRRTEGGESGALPIAMFGGSTMWGGYARDGHTIPSELARRLSAAGKVVDVVNHGQVGFVFSQEIHQALRLAYEAPGSRFAGGYMIFMDGICDVLSTLANFVNGVDDPAGKPWEFEKYDYLFRMGNTGEVSWSDVLRKSKAARVILRLGGERGWWPAERKNVHRAPGPEDWKRLAREAAGAYLRMVSTANATFRANGAHPIFVLQPTIFAKRELVPDEKRMVESNQGWKDYLLDAYARIREGSSALGAGVTFWDLADAFAEERGALFADVMHYSEKGNAVIAEEIGKRLVPLLEKRSVNVVDVRGGRSFGLAQNEGGE